MSKIIMGKYFEQFEREINYFFNEQNALKSVNKSSIQDLKKYSDNFKTLITEDITKNVINFELFETENLKLFRIMLDNSSRITSYSFLTDDNYHIVNGVIENDYDYKKNSQLLNKNSRLNELTRINTRTLIINSKKHSVNNSRYDKKGLTVEKILRYDNFPEQPSIINSWNNNTPYLCLHQQQPRKTLVKLGETMFNDQDNDIILKHLQDEYEFQIFQLKNMLELAKNPSTKNNI